MNAQKKYKKVLIAGGAGFVGYHLAKNLINNNYQVTIADNFSRGRRDEDIQALGRLPNVNIHECDLTLASDWARLGGGYEQIYHLVSVNGTRLFYENPFEVLRVGSVSANCCIEWIAHVNGIAKPKVLFTSSNEAYAGALEAFGVLPIPTNEAVPLVVADVFNPRWSYGGQKLFCELLFVSAAKKYGFSLVITRPHNFYGPRAGSEHVIPEIIQRVIDKQDPFKIYGADETRAFCYIDDAVDALERLMVSPVSDGNIYNVGTCVESRISDVAEEIFGIMGWRPSRVVHEPSRRGSVKRRLPDVGKIYSHIGWVATSEFRYGLTKTIEWYFEHRRGCRD